MESKSKKLKKELDNNQVISSFPLNHMCSISLHLFVFLQTANSIEVLYDKIKLKFNCFLQ